MAVAIPSGFQALSLSTAQLSLAAVLQCGQSFRWSVFPLACPEPLTSPDDPRHEYRFCLRDRVVCLRQAPNILFYRSVYPPSSLSHSDETAKDAETLSWIRDYFQLDVDLMDLYARWSKADSVFRNVKERFQGIRVLRQDPFECLLSFICSSNNNITRITKMVRALCTHYSPVLVSISPPGPDHSDALEPYHPFPPPSVLAAPQVASTLRTLGFGYRANFVQKTAKMLYDAHNNQKVETDSIDREPAEQWLLTLRQMTTVDAREELLKFMGVGRKVADCVLLMSLDKREVVPVDTHVHQIAVKHYGMRGSGKTKTALSLKLYEEVNTKLADIWGGSAGWAHSVLFTSDLKAFASYGLLQSTPSASSSKIPTPATSMVDSPTPSPTKRKRTASLLTVIDTQGAVEASVETSGDSTLAERVKRRRQTRVVGQSQSG